MPTIKLVSLSLVTQLSQKWVANCHEQNSVVFKWTIVNVCIIQQMKYIHQYMLLQNMFSRLHLVFEIDVSEVLKALWDMFFLYYWCNHSILYWWNKYKNTAWQNKKYIKNTRQCMWNGNRSKHVFKIQ